MVNEFPFGTSQSGKRTTFSEFPFVQGIFQWDETQKLLPFTCQPEFPGLVVNGKQPETQSSGDIRLLHPASSTTHWWTPQGKEYFLI